MRRLHQQFPDELVILGIHSAKFPSEQLTANIRQAVMRLGIDHPVVNDAGFRIWSEYAVKAWPTLVLIDPRGRIVDTFSGEILAEEFAREIRAVIAAHADEIDRTPWQAASERQAQAPQPLRYPSKLLAVPGTASMPDRLFIADSGHHQILEVQLDADGLGGDVSRIFGSGIPGLMDGQPQQAAFNAPHGLSLMHSDRGETLYVADTENHAVRAIDLATGSTRTVAGTGAKAHGSFELRHPSAVPLRSPWAVLALPPYVFVAMAGSHQIWVIIADEQMGPFAGTGQEALVDGPPAQASFNQPSDLGFGINHLFLADAEASAIRAIPLTSAEASTITLVGQGLFEFGDRDGVGAEVRLQHPTGLALSPEEDLVYIADTYNNKIKILDPQTGQVQTLIGSGEAGSHDGPFTSASLFEPEGIQALGSRLFIADTNNHVIRVADLQTQTLTTFQLRGRAAVTKPASPVTQAGEPVLVAPGQVRITLDLQLPAGHKLNPAAPSAIVAYTPDWHQTLTYRDLASQTIEFEVTKDIDLGLDLAIYYCQANDENLCRIYGQELVIPLQVRPDAPSSVTLPLIVPAP